MIAQFTAGMDYKSYSADEAYRSAVERQFIIIGEALNRLSKLNLEVLKNIPGYRVIVNFRNILVHGYDRVEDEVVWGIVKTHTHMLSDTAKKLIEEL
jgi:uncharacterized protein with HEPN domain